MVDPISDTLLSDFRQSLADCQRLYRESAEYCVRFHPSSIKRSSLHFLELMDDLHRGLLVKIYLAASLLDHRWVTEERQLARILVQHAWGQELDGSDLRTAAEHLAEEVEKMSWFSLIRPFVEIEPLRERVAELEAVVIRIATIVAICDGTITATEERFLKSLREELEQHLRPLTLGPDRTGTERSGPERFHEQQRTNVASAVRKLAEEPVCVPGTRTVSSSLKPTLPDRPAEMQLQESLAELDCLIGLASVKHEIRTLANLLRLQQHREASGLPRTPVSLHMVFQGNPGTGKTTVARLVAQIYRAMGIVKQGHLVETDRSGLVAQYAGQTGPKTNARVDEALDGVLFVDEAYSLVAAEGDDPYGREALQTLLKRMEDDRDRFVVILAGYPEPMRQLLLSNPGLSSRFSRSLEFVDYEPRELCQIFAHLCEVNHFELTCDVRIRLMIGFQSLFAQRDEHFGNGRLVRNIFENAIRQLANRIAGAAEVNHELLTQFHTRDIAWPGVPESIFPPDISSLKVFVPCPGCREDRTMAATMLGRRVECSSCHHRFVAEWGTRIDGPP